MSSEPHHSSASVVICRSPKDLPSIVILRVDPNPSVLIQTVERCLEYRPETKKMLVITIEERRKEKTIFFSFIKY